MATRDYGYKEEEGHWLTSLYWQQQMQLAQLSRQINSPHSYARSAAAASRSANSSQVPLTVADLAAQLANQQSGQSVSNGSTTNGGPQTPGRPGSSATMNPQVKKDQLEEEKQRRINEDIKKQFWTAIDLSGQSLIKITPKLFNYTFLQKLYLNHNKLVQIPDSISKLTQLKVLDLSDNLLTELPSSLGNMYTLRYLFLFDNRLSNLPYEFGFLFQLEMLGIEGNPINEHTREIMGKQGTKGVIIDLRERAPVTVQSPPRKWLELSNDNKMKSDNDVTKDTEDDADNKSKTRKHNPNKVSIMSYNTLCDNLANAQLYAYTPSWALAWKHRKDLITQEILSIDSDIICLQEVDQSAFDEWSAVLKDKNFAGLYWPKSRARTLQSEERKKVDGCAIYYDTTKFRLIERCPVEYNALSLRKDDFKRTDDIYNRVMNKDNVALITVLERISGPDDEEPLEGPTLFIVTTTHLLWNPTFSDVKIVQVALLLEELDRVAAKYASNAKYPEITDGKKIPMIIAGDFNSTPDSGVYQLFSQGRCPPNHPELNQRVYGKYTEDGMSHRFALRSAFADIGELPFTNYTPNFVQPIDQMWYTTPTMEVTSILGGIDKSYTDHFVGFPNAHHPSDHIPIAATFSFKKPKEERSKPPPPNFGAK